MFFSWYKELKHISGLSRFLNPWYLQLIHLSKWKLSPPPLLQHMTGIHLTLLGTLTTAILSDIILTLKMVIIYRSCWRGFWQWKLMAGWGISDIFFWKLMAGWGISDIFFRSEFLGSALGGRAEFTLNCGLQTPIFHLNQLTTNLSHSFLVFFIGINNKLYDVHMLLFLWLARVGFYLFGCRPGHNLSLLHHTAVLGQGW